MALDLDELNSVSKKHYDKTMTSQVYDEHAFFAKLKADHKIKQEFGRQLQWPIRYRKLGRAGAIGFKEQVTFESKETRTGAVLDYAAYEVDATMHWDERIKNYGSGRIIDLAGDKAKELKEDMLDVMATALYATSVGAQEIESIEKIVDSAQAYGGIAVADADEWKATEDSSQTVLLPTGSASLAYMRNQATFQKHGPTMHLTTRDLVTKYESLLHPNMIYEDKQMANLGFANITFYQKPVIGDSYCTTNYWYGLDMDAFELWCHPEYDMVTSDWFDLKQIGFIHALSKVLTWSGNLVCRRRKTSFKFSALDYTL